MSKKIVKNSFNGPFRKGNNKGVDDKEGKKWAKIISLNLAKEHRIMASILKLEKREIMW